MRKEGELPLRGGRDQRIPAQLQGRRDHLHQVIRLAALELMARRVVKPARLSARLAPGAIGTPALMVLRELVPPVTP
jgi:hypothetical protein